ncbi:MAG TPA: hypothetical protein ENI59_01560 [Euryarchaeota archaeon]|nr:hypothetical protein [Euryarchaeota archaeon]
MDEMVEKIVEYCRKRREMAWSIEEVAASKDMKTHYAGQAIAYSFILDYIEEIMNGGEDDE